LLVIEEEAPALESVQQQQVEQVSLTAGIANII